MLSPYEFLSLSYHTSLPLSYRQVYATGFTGCGQAGCLIGGRLLSCFLLFIFCSDHGCFMCSHGGGLKANVFIK